jgi:hypothetical protein
MLQGASYMNDLRLYRSMMQVQMARKITGRDLEKDPLKRKGSCVRPVIIFRNSWSELMKRYR